MSNTPEKCIKEEELTPKNEVYARLMQQGLSNPVIAKALDITPQRGNQIKKQLSGKYEFKDSKLVKKAYRRANNILDGKPWGAVETIKASDVVSVIKLIKDRDEPTTSNPETLNDSTHLHPINVVNFTTIYGNGNDSTHLHPTLDTPSEVLDVIDDEGGVGGDGE